MRALKSVPACWDIDVVDKPAYQIARPPRKRWSYAHVLIKTIVWRPVRLASRAVGCFVFLVFQAMGNFFSACSANKDGDLVRAGVYYYQVRRWHIYMCYKYMRMLRGDVFGCVV